MGEPPMIIALDYDGTYTRDPPLWDNFIRMAERAGHEVICCTMRSPKAAIQIPVKVFYTSCKAKKSFLEAEGIFVDIWIDDSPDLVTCDAARL